MVNIKTQLIPIGTKRRSGIKMKKVDFFVDHDTGNPNSTAQNNANYYINSANTMSASAHAFIDDIEVIICVPCLPADKEKAWHVRYDEDIDNKLMGDDANDIAIGLELCYFPDDNDDEQRSLRAYNNYIEFAAYLAYLHNIDPGRRAGHFELDPTRRTDPNNALKFIGKTYNDMKNDIVTKFNDLYQKKEANLMDEAKEVQEIKVPEWAKEAWEWAKEVGINDGKVDSMEEIRTMCYLYRFYKTFVK